MEHGMLISGGNSLQGSRTGLAAETPNEAHGLNRSLSTESGSSIQQELDEPRTSNTSLYSRFCELSWVRKVIDFFKSIFFCFNKSSDSNAEETNHGILEEENTILDEHIEDNDVPLLDDHVVVQPDNDELLLLATDDNDPLSEVVTEERSPVEEGEEAESVVATDQDQQDTTVNTEAENETAQAPEDDVPPSVTVPVDETAEESGEGDIDPQTLAGHSLSITVTAEETVDSSSPEPLEDPVSPTIEFEFGGALDLVEMADEESGEYPVYQDPQLNSMLSTISERTEPDSRTSSLVIKDGKSSEAASSDDQEPVPSTSYGTQLSLTDDDDSDGSIVLFEQRPKAKASPTNEDDDTNSLASFERLEAQMQAEEQQAEDQAAMRLEHETSRSTSSESSSQAYTKAWIEEDHDSNGKSFVARFTKRRRAMSELNLNTLDTTRPKGKSRSQAASDHCSELSENLPHHKAKIRAENIARRGRLEKINDKEARKNRTAFGSSKEN